MTDMNFDLNEDQTAFDQEHKFPVDALRKAAEQGFAGIYVRDDVGASALTRLDAAIIFEELAAADPSTAAYIPIHNMVSWMIDNDELRRRYLPKLTTVEHFASHCLTEPGAGSDAASLRTRAERDGDHYVPSGAKRSSSAAEQATSMSAWCERGQVVPATYPVSSSKRAHLASCSESRRRSRAGTASRRRAMEAAQAERSGLVSRVIPAAELIAGALKIAETGVHDDQIARSS
jgi:hypothetical protein